MKAKDYLKEASKEFSNKLTGMGIDLEGRAARELFAAAIGSSKAFGPLCAAAEADQNVLKSLDYNTGNLRKAIDKAISEHPELEQMPWERLLNEDLRVINPALQLLSLGGQVFVDKHPLTDDGKQRINLLTDDAKLLKKLGFRQASIFSDDGYPFYEEYDHLHNLEDNTRSFWVDISGLLTSHDNGWYCSQEQIDVMAEICEKYPRETGETDLDWSMRIYEMDEFADDLGGAFQAPLAATEPGVWVVEGLSKNYVGYLDNPSCLITDRQVEQYSKEGKFYIKHLNGVTYMLGGSITKDSII